MPTFLLAQTVTLTIGSASEIRVHGRQNVAIPDPNLVIGGNLVVQLGGTLNMDRDAEAIISGDITYQGTSYLRAISTLTLNGTTKQTISNTGGNADFSVYNLVVDNPAGVDLVMTGGSDLDIFGVLTLTNGDIITNGDLIIEDVNPSNYGRVAYSNSGSVIGNTQVRKRLTNTNTGWRQISMPTAGVLSSNFSNITLLLSDHTPTNQINTFKWDPTASGTGDYAKGWIAADPADGETMAYSVYNSGTSTVNPISLTIRSTGILNVGDYNFPLEFTRDPKDDPATNDDAKGWNFIPNPWAALVDVDVLLGDATNFTTGYKAVHVWDAVNQNYRAVLANGATKVNWNTGGIDLDRTTTNIPPMQGFWVKADAAGQICTLVDATMRTTDFKGNVVFMKKNFDLLRLNVFDADSAWDQLVVYYEPMATNGFDLSGDGYYLTPQNKNTPVFYGTEGQSRASIISRESNTTDSIPVAFSSLKNNSRFYINTDLSNLAPNWYVYLKDKNTGNVYDLRDSENISFSHNKTNNPNRFMLYYSQNPKAFKKLLNPNNGFISFVRNEQLVLQSNGASGLTEISIFDIYGRLLYTQNEFVDVTSEIELGLTPTQNIVFIKTSVGGKIQVEKIFY